MFDLIKKRLNLLLQVKLNLSQFHFDSSFLQLKKNVVEYHFVKVIHVGYICMMFFPGFVVPFCKSIWFYECVLFLAFVMFALCFRCVSLTIIKPDQL